MTKEELAEIVANNTDKDIKLVFKCTYVFCNDFDSDYNLNISSDEDLNDSIDEYFQEQYYVDYEISELDLYIDDDYIHTYETTRYDANNLTRYCHSDLPNVEIAVEFEEE